MCDTIAVVESDRVLFAKNSDRDPNEAQLLEWHPRRSHGAGERLRCTWIEVPQVAETHAILISRPFWMWGAEIGANEHGVVIGNEAVFTREPYAATGLTGMDLLRLALERAANAQEALAVITELLERYGQGGGCGHENRAFTYHNSFIIADPRSALVLETAGREWAVEHVQAGVRSISNGLTIPGFAGEHSDVLKTRVSACRARRTLTESGAAGGNPSVRDLMTILRSHGNSEWPHYSPVNGAMSAPCMHAGGLLAASQTTASWVAELTPGGCRIWATATAAPCTSLFKPVTVEEPVELGPPPIDRFNPDTLWWRHELLHRTAIKSPEIAMRFTAERDDVEQRWLADPPGPADAFEEADELLRGWTEELPPLTDVRPWWVRRYWQERDRRAGLDLTPAGPGTLRSAH